MEKPWVEIIEQPKANSLRFVLTYCIYYIVPDFKKAGLFGRISSHSENPVHH
jgi:hypothetical protein